MQCPLCECDVTTDNSQNLSGVKFGTTVDGVLYCHECCEVAYFAQDMASRPEKKIEPVKEDVEKVKPVTKTTNVIHFYCAKCKAQASGTKCETCGTQNPLCRKKK